MHDCQDNRVGLAYRQGNSVSGGSRQGKNNTQKEPVEKRDIRKTPVESSRFVNQSILLSVVLVLDFGNLAVV